ncbi:MinD/ParA family protein [Lacrimispora saccharolytica]|uniref:MinD/ParA family protein n=1 Tax=Lacrimispora saccharolytica TaxID=84030 RepID=UPI001B53D5E7|nr:MinD/ParA family protein [Lacrimispora saccharolytica]MBP9000603.1 MinD/ParA family protein [Lachnospiraceae bacterium]MBS7330108.1 MinD/ParA family protein [Lachnospiraceae bacterium]MCF2655819.1 MinD/ParA family protein [Lacrimispora saccharolytica]MCI7558252.1 MinD/ParA family protein [Lachnospiraceae bacterium]MDD7548721.1 MinD/ParA family protein [Lachnospiraceae bacterium]
MDQAQQLRNIVKANSPTSNRPLARVITVTSGKGGVGKSNTAINLAIQFRKMGQRVIILDADFGLANIEIMFGTVPKHNLCDLIYQGKNIKEIITWGPGDVGFISGGSGIAGLSNLSRDYLVYIIQNLAELDAIADVIIIDTGAGISDAVLEFLVASGEILLVTTPEPTSITDSYSLLKALNRHPRFSKEASQIKVIANKVDRDEAGLALFNKLNVVVQRYLKLPISYLGTVPQDEKLSQAVMQQTPVSLANPQAKSAKAYERIAAVLMNKELSGNVKKRGMAAFFSHIVTGKKLD